MHIKHQDRTVVCITSGQGLGRAWGSLVSLLVTLCFLFRFAQEVPEPSGAECPDSGIAAQTSLLFPVHREAKGCPDLSPAGKEEPAVMGGVTGHMTC